MTLRMADADILPFDFSGFTDNVAKFEKEVEELADKMREETDRLNELITSGTYDYTLDPTKELKPPAVKDPVPFLNFASLQNALTNLEKSAAKYAELAAANPKPNTNMAELNKLLYQAEQKLLSPAGLPRRPWFRHTIYAPGFYTGYGVKTLPGIREAIEQRNWKEAQEQVEIAASAIEAYTRQVDAATKILMMK